MRASDSRFQELFLVATLAFVGTMLPSGAQAIPAFARQTEQPCATCHVGSFGPQLTDYGRDFKMNGYVWGKEDVKPWEHLSVMAFGGLESYGRGLTKQSCPTSAGPLTSCSSNNNLALDQAALFYGGRIYDKVGAFIQTTYADPQKNFHIDNTDIRFADTGNIGDHLILYGATINNNPTVQDVWQTAPAWIFPYAGSSGIGGGQTPPIRPMVWSITPQTVMGAGLYAELDDTFYFEFTNYTGMNRRIQQFAGIPGADQANRLGGFNPYWRFTYDTHDGEQSFEIGTYGMDFHIWPGNVRNAGSDHRRDYAVDASYQRFIDDSKHIVSLYATAIHEDIDLNSTFTQGNSSGLRAFLNTYSANASYYYDNTYGITVGRTVTTGSADAGLYGTNSVSNKPDTSAWNFQVDFTPFGAEKSYGAPYLNLRVFAQYTLYDKYYGAARNYDGNGANAGDNNTFFFGVWTAF